MFKEFKEFAMKGNVIDMAVGIVIGAAFAPIVKSLVKDVIMPPIGLLLGKVNFEDLHVVIKDDAVDASYATVAAAAEAGAVTVNYGMFINTVVNFIIVAFAIFMVVKAMNAAKKAPPPADPTTRDCPKCTSKVSLKASRCPHCTSELSPV